MFLKLKNDHSVQGVFHGSFENIESTDLESMEVRFKFNPCHYPDDDITFCFEANITDNILKRFGVEMDETDSKDDFKDDSEDSEYANEAKLQFYLYENGKIGSCS